MHAGRSFKSFTLTFLPWTKVNSSCVHCFQYHIGSIVHLSLMEPTLENEEKKNSVKLGADDEEDKKAVPLLLVELVLNVPPTEEGGGMLAII